MITENDCKLIVNENFKMRVNNQKNVKFKFFTKRVECTIAPLNNIRH